MKYYYYNLDGGYHLSDTNENDNYKLLKLINYKNIDYIGITELLTIENNNNLLIKDIFNKILKDCDRSYKLLCNSISSYNYKLYYNNKLKIIFYNYSQLNNYIELLTRFYKYVDIYKIPNDFIVFRKFSPSLSYDPKLRVTKEVNEEYMYSVISTSYKYKFPLYDWGTPNGCLYLIKINKDSKYIVHPNGNNTQHEITLAPGIIKINKIKKLKAPFDVDYYDEELFSDYIDPTGLNRDIIICICEYKSYNLETIIEQLHKNSIINNL
jgi:hypothetical protein